MKKLLLAFMLLASQAAAQRYDGVDPCAGPGMMRTIIDSAAGVIVSTESSAGGGGGLFCNVAISSGLIELGAMTDNYVACIDSRPTSAGAASTVGALGVQIGISTDTRQVFPPLIASSGVVTGLPASFKSVPFKNLFCDLGSVGTKAIVYWVPALR